MSVGDDKQEKLCLREKHTKAIASLQSNTHAEKKTSYL